VPNSVPVHQLGVDVSGGTLAVFRLGAELPSTPPVLAVHGITSNSRSWLPVARRLDGRAGVVAADLRGRAASGGLPGPYGIAAHADDLVAVLDRLDIERAVLVGHSLGAYIVARLAADHPRRVHAAVLVDGGLTVPGSEGADPEEFVEALLGPTLARLKLTFPSPQAYHEWWRQHPAIAGSDVADDDLVAFADHDLTGTEPELHSSVSAEAVRGDSRDLAGMGQPAHRLDVSATLLVAPRGFQNDPHPMQPLVLAQAWAAEDPGRRRASLVADVNHYTITLGAAGASAVAETVLAALPA
jgi:pimeloyl-ACP methyl ester carboxylesterase